MRLNASASVYSEEQLRAYLSACRFPGFQGNPEPHVALPEPSLKTLSLVMIHHLTTFPFENTAIHYEPTHSMSIDPEDIYERFVLKKHGGYCMQGNRLFLNMLLKLGFDAFMVSGRVCGSSDPNPPPDAWTGPTHVAILVQLPCHLDDREPQRKALYLTDVAFGARGLMRPMLLRDGHQERGRASVEHRIIKAPIPMSSFDVSGPGQEDDLIPNEVLQSQFLWRLQRRDGPDQPWGDNYALSMTEVFPNDLRVGNAFTATHPDSIFTRTITIVGYNLELKEGWEKAIQEKREGEGLSADLYPYHPTQIGQNVIFGAKLTRSSVSSASQVELQTEKQRVEAIQNVFGLLKGSSVEETLNEMKGRVAEIQLTQ